MAALVILSLVILGASFTNGGHTSVDCCMNELCPYDCVRCDGKPTCYDLSDELGCNNKTDSVLRSYPKPPIFIPAVMGMLKDHLLKQKKEMAHILTHKTCFRKPEYRHVAQRQRNKPTATQYPPWLKLLEQLKDPNAPTTTQAPPVWLKLLMKLRSEASTTTTTTTTPRPTTTTEMSIVDILFEWMRLKQERDSKTPAPRVDKDYTKYKIPTSPDKATVKAEKVVVTSPTPTASPKIVFTSPDMTTLYTKLTHTANVPLPTKAPTVLNTARPTVLNITRPTALNAVRPTVGRTVFNAGGLPRGPLPPPPPPRSTPLPPPPPSQDNLNTVKVQPEPSQDNLNTVKVQPEPSHEHHKKPQPLSPIDNIYSDPSLSYWPVYVDPKQRENLVTTIASATTTKPASSYQMVPTTTQTPPADTPTTTALKTTTGVGFDETSTTAHTHEKSMQTTTGVGFDETSTTVHTHEKSMQTTTGADEISTTTHTHTESLQTTTGFGVDRTSTEAHVPTKTMETTTDFGIDGTSTSAHTHATSANNVSEETIVTTDFSVQTSTVSNGNPISSTPSAIVTSETPDYNSTTPTVEVSTTSTVPTPYAQINETTQKTTSLSAFSTDIQNGPVDSNADTRPSEQLAVTEIPTSTHGFDDSALKQKIISTTGNYETPATGSPSDMFSVQASSITNNNRAAETETRHNATTLISDQTSASVASQSLNESSVMNTTSSASLPEATIESRDAAGFSHTVPQVTTSDNEKSNPAADGRKTMKVFVNFSDIVSDIVASTPSLKTVNKPHISPTSASKTITSLFPDPTYESRLTNTQQSIQQTIRTPEPWSRRSGGVMPVETKLFGRVRVNEKEPKKVASHNIAGVQVNRQDFLENSRPVQRFVGPINPSAVPAPARTPVAQIATRPHTPPAAVYQFNALPTTAPTPTWWQTTNSPFGIGDMWGRTTAFPDTTSNWWSQTTSNAFWNSLFGYVPTTQRNFIQPQQRLVPYVRPATAIQPVIQTTSRPLAPPTATQTPLYQIPSTTTAQVATSNQHVTEVHQKHTTTPPTPVTTRSTTQTTDQSPTTDITLPNDLAHSTNMSSPSVDITLPNDLTPTTTVPTPTEFSSQSGISFPTFTFTTPPSYDPHQNHSSVGTHDNRTETSNVTAPWQDQSLNTTSISILRNLYLDILEAQRIIEGQGENITHDHSLHTHVNGTTADGRGVTFNTTAWTTGAGRVRQEVVKPDFRTTQTYVKPFITTQSTVDKTEFNWWNSRSSSTPLVVGRSTNSAVSPTIRTSDRLEPETRTAIPNDTSYDVTHTQSITPTSSVAANTNVPTRSSPGTGSTNIPANSSPGMHMSNMLGVTIPDIYPTVNSIPSFRFELTNTPRNNDIIRPTPSNIDSHTGAYNIKKPVLAEWSGRHSEILYKTKSPTRESWWDKIMTAVTEASNVKVDQRHGPRDTQPVTYNLFQTTTSAGNTGAPRGRTFTTRATNAGVTERTLLYHDVTPPRDDGSHSKNRECRLVHDAGEFCSTRHPGYYKNAANCRSFFVCDRSNKFVCPCPPGTAFDDNLNVCNWEYNVKCTTPLNF